MDFFATANSACIGTDANASLRTAPSSGSPFSSSTPDNDRDHHGPIIEILGQGAQPGNGADFRGFVALDIRNFLNTSSQLYYNDVPTGTTSSTLKDLAARWIYTGGYPGPPLVTPTTPLDSMDQVGLLNGNSTGAAIDAVDQRFSPGDPVLVAVYSGLTMQIPDFQMNSPASITLPATATTASVGSFKVSRNQSFAGVGHALDARRRRRHPEPDHRRDPDVEPADHLLAEPRDAVDGPGHERHDDERHDRRRRRPGSTRRGYAARPAART